MFALNGFEALSPFHQVGLVPGQGDASSRASVAPGLSMVSPRTDEHPPPWSPDNPLFWFGAFLAVTFGLVGASTSVKLGPFKGAVSAGSTK